MNLPFSEYLSPTNPIASWIVIILQYLFLFWCIGLITCVIWLRAKLRQTSKNEDVESLAKARLKQNPKLEENKQKEEMDSAFRKFYPSKSLRERSPIVQHLKAIFLAGWVESRLEVGELIDHTTSNLFRCNGILRSVLAIFIIIGLLGTLFGLTDSLMELAPALQASVTDATSAENSEKMTQALRHLLTEMKGALAPSIWGIGFTILGVIFYNAYLQIACHPVKSTLERLTLTVWVPQLYPTTSQKLIQTLQQSEAQMRRGYETAAQVGDLVGTVQDNISEFNQNLSRANEITQPLSESVSQINQAAEVLNEAIAQELSKFSQQFTKAVTRLTGFQDEIRNLYQQLTAESEIFQRGANQKLDEQTQKLEAQNQNLIALLAALKSYEEANITSREQINEELKNFLKEATAANTSINDSNRELLEGIRDQLTTNLDRLNTDNRELLEQIRGQLTTDLNSLQGVLDTQLQTLTNQLTTDLTKLGEGLNQKLEALTNRFNSFDVPLEKAADQIAGIVDGFARFMRTTVGDLQIQFQQQNANNKDQLDAITKLNTEIELRLSQLAENSENQKGEISELGSSVNSLTADVSNLTNSIQSLGTLSESIGAIEQHVETLGTASELIEEHVETLVDKADVTPLTEGIGRLNESINAIAQHSQTLAESAQRLAGEAPSSRRNRSQDTKIIEEILQRISKLFRRKP